MKKINKGKVFRRSLLIFFTLIAVGLFFANRFVKTKGFDNVSDFISNYKYNKNLADLVEPEILKIYTSEEDFQFLQGKRDEAVERGIQINEGESYVQCKLVAKDNDTIIGEMRLKGHMTDHLEGNKWSFRVKTDGEYKNMYRFSLQNPSTRSYANEWLYHELLKSEGIMALKYDFIRLTLNDEDLGIYAIEEHFGQHVPRDNNRPEGAILRWNPELYWDWRIKELHGDFYDNQNGEYQNSYVEPYDKGTVKKDSLLTLTYLKGAEKLEGFRRGEYSASQVFDIELMAKFHAVIDLVGGYHSLDWSDIKFFYNQESDKIEPIGYESFSIRETIAVAGQRSPEPGDNLNLNYHDQLFSDPLFYVSYVNQLMRICDKKYFSEFQKKVKPELDKKLGILAHEFSYIKFSFAPYFKNIEKIQNILDLHKPLHAFLEDNSDDSIRISVAPVSDFPLWIKGVVFNGKNEIRLKENILVPAKPRNSFGEYFDFTIANNGFKIKNLELIASIPGGKEFKIEISELPSFKFMKEANIIDSPVNTGLKSLTENSYFFNRKQIVIDKQLVIHADEKLKLYPGQEVTFTENGGLLIYGDLVMQGTEDEPVIFNLEKMKSIQIENGKMEASYTFFSNGKENSIKAFQSDIELNSCTFYRHKSSILMVQESKVILNACISDDVECWVKANRSEIIVDNCNAFNGKQMLEVNTSLIKMNGTTINAFETAVKLDHISTFLGWNCIFEENDLFVQMNNASFTRIIGSNIISSKGLGFEIDQSSFSTKASVYDLYKTTINVESEVSNKG